LIGVGISAAGATVAAPMLLITGVVTIGGAILYAGYRGLPPTLIPAKELVGKIIPLETLNSIERPVLKLGIVGTTQSGKTTFLKQVLQQPTETSRTNNVYASIVTLQTTPAEYIALIDGDGYQYDQQFQVAEHADFLIVFIDHSLGNQETNLSSNRLDEHDRFIGQLEPHTKRKNQVTKIHLLLNKRDLWQKSEDAEALTKWFENHASSLKKSMFPTEVTSEVHSNLNASDINKVLRLISNRAKEI
jgi:GTPase SAR1 family protein